MIENSFDNPTDMEFAKSESDYTELHNKIKNFFGEDIFLLDEPGRENLIEEKVPSMFESNRIRIDLLILRQRIDAKIEVLKTELDTSPDNLSLKKHITELQDESIKVQQLFKDCQYA